MENKTFLNISTDECLTVYKKILVNSNKCWESGKMLAKNENYGLGISTSIISIEELIKAIIVFLDGKGFEFRQSKGIESFFRNHEIRYLIAYFIFIIALTGDELKKAFKKINDNPNKVSELVKSMREDKDFFEKKFGYYLRRKVVILKQELNWFSKIDLFRQRGFYCDYNNKLESPINVLKEDYEEVIIRLQRVRNAGIDFLEQLSKNETDSSTQVEQLKAEFKEKKLYEKITRGLELIKKSKNKPFEYLKNILNDFPR